MRDISQFFTRQSFSYLISLPTVFSILKNAPQFIQSYISGNMNITDLHFRNGYTYTLKNFDDLGVFYEIFIKKEYGNITIKDSVIIDIGANNGLFMLYCKYKNPDAIIHCFEPIPMCAKNIHTMISTNNLKNVFVHEIAISDKEGNVSIYLDTQTIAATLHKSIAGGQNEIIVKTSTLTHQLKTLDIGHVDFLKMDCEGSEYEIIDSLSESDINSYRKIMIEWHNVDDKKTGLNLYNTLRKISTHKHITYIKHSGHGNNGFIKLTN